MKKLSLVMAAAMCMTVGGVYAAWTYAETPVGSFGTRLPITVEGAVANSTKGLIAADTTRVTFTIDQDISTDEIKMQHKAKLVSEGTMSVTFTPNSPDMGVTQDVYNNGIVLKMVIKENLGSWERDNVDILQLVDTDGEGDLVKIESGCLVITLNSGNPIKGMLSDIDISDYLAIGELYLETYEEHSAFTEYVRGITDKIHVYVADAETPLEQILSTQVSNS